MNKRKKGTPRVPFLIVKLYNTALAGGLFLDIYHSC